MHVKNICLERKEKELFYKGITYLILKGTSISEKDYCLIIRMSNLYKLTTNLAKHALRSIGEAKLLLRENQMRTVRRVKGTREKALTNIILNKHHDYKLKIVWKDFKKTYGSVTHTYLNVCTKSLSIPE